MKQFIDKLIERLEETDFNDIQMVVSEVLEKYGFPKESIVQDEVWDDLDELLTNKFAIQIINKLAEEYNNGWIPFTQRELTEEEKEHYGNEIEFMLDCKLPEEDEEILVTSKYKDKLYVDTDIFMRDGSECYLDSGRDLVTDVIAWMPLPAPYKKGE